VAVVHGKASQLAWGLSEDQIERCARLFGRESREEGREPRCPVSASGQSESVRRGVGCTPEAGEWGWGGALGACTRQVSGGEGW
jgi:hypothetical protein